MKTTKNLNVCFCVRALGAQCHARPHREDPEKLVLKTGNMQTLFELCSMLGVQTGKTWEGQNYHITEVSKAEFSEAIKKLVAGEITVEIDEVETDADASEYEAEGPVVNNGGEC